MTMPAEILDSLRESAEPALDDGEHRDTRRVPVGTTVAVTVTPVDLYASTSTMKMRIADYSPGGIGLLCGETISIGSDVLIRLPRKAASASAGGGSNRSGSEHDGFNLRCSVCSCRGVADGVFRVGVRFESLEK
jgi:hypothetical protein